MLCPGASPAQGRIRYRCGMPTLARICVTPVKGLALLHPKEVLLEDVGLRENRLFYLVDDAGEHVADIEHPELVRVRPEFDPQEEWLRLRFPDGAMAEGSATALGAPVVTTLSRRPVPGHVVEGPFARALSSFAGESLRLVRADRPGDGPDVHHLSVLSLASVEELGRRGGLDGTLDSRRFRMNFELDGCTPHQEDSWAGRRVAFGDAVVRMLGPVPRCVVTAQNPDTGERDFDALKVIPTYRPLMVREGRRPGIPFGMYAEVEEPGRVGLGDPVSPLA